jgi:hypothetical protein
MSYGVVVSKDSFVFTRFGAVPVSQLPAGAEVLGVQGIGKCTEYLKISLNGERKSTGIRLITQTTDSILLPNALVFSEGILEARDLCSKNGIEFYRPSKPHDFNPGLKGAILDMQPNVAYIMGLTCNVVCNRPRCVAFLIRSATDLKYIKSVERDIARIVDPKGKKIKVAIKQGKLGYLWIILKGDAVGEMRETLRCVSPETACIQLDAESLRSFVAGMLDAYVGKSLYGDNPVLVFSKGNSAEKRFLHAILTCYGCSITETSCITSHAPKFLESAADISEKIPTRNPIWKEVADVREQPALFSRIRAYFDVQTVSTNMTFPEGGFSPISDGLYTYPRLLSDQTMPDKRPEIA